MFIVLLKFSEQRSQAGAWMEGHKAWLQQGFDDGVFVLAGSLQPQQGGGILAHHTSLAALQQRVAADPFVEHDVVRAEVIELAASRAEARLQFLLEGAA